MGLPTRAFIVALGLYATLGECVESSRSVRDSDGGDVSVSTGGRALRAAFTLKKKRVVGEHEALVGPHGYCNVLLWLWALLSPRGAQ